MKEVKKLTALDFKKEQLVNLNEEEMEAVKGGTSGLPCATLGVGFAALAYQFGKGESFWHCADTGGGNDTGDFYPTKYNLGDDVTCASVDWVYIYGY